MRWRGWVRRWGSRVRVRRTGWRSSIRLACPALTPSSRGSERGLPAVASSGELFFDSGDLVGGSFVGVAGHVEALLGLVGGVARRGEAAFELAALRLLTLALGLLAGSLG